MPSLTDLHRAVESVLATQRIGQPVFVRYVRFGGAQSEDVAFRLAALVTIIRSWFNQPIQHLSFIGAKGLDAPAVLLQFAAGATALVSLAVGDPAVDLTILGNHGAIYHQVAFDALDGLPPADSDLVRQIERGLFAKEAVL
jgi:hypothetical protein